MEEINIKSKDGYELNLHLFKVNNPRGVVQIIHGMEEHQERYENIAKSFNEIGLSVVTSDMRGHGNKAQTLGYFKDKKGYEELIKDQKCIRDFIDQEFKGLSVYLFAHSMGTIISRVLLQDSSKRYDKVVLSGYPNYQFAAYFGIAISSLIRLFKGPTYKSKFLENLSVGQFNKVISNPNTNSDWISYNPDNIKKYIEDPLCGFGFTCSAFNDLFHLVTQMHKSKKYVDVNNDLPFLLVSGKDDPCTGGAKGLADSYKVLSKANFNNIKVITYDNMRHEIINELNNEVVFDDILDFFN